jgi:hypothetical protein
MFCENYPPARHNVQFPGDIPTHVSYDGAQNSVERRSLKYENIPLVDDG